MRQALWTIVLIVVFQSALSSARINPPQGTTGDVEQQIQKSSYIFVGVVQKTNATTVPLVPASDRTAVVRVEEVLFAPKNLANYTGHDVTVELREGSSIKAGDRLAFFTNGG